MANYTSAYTGAQIDAAVTKVNSITSTAAQVDAAVTRLGQITSTPNQIDTVVSKVNAISSSSSAIVDAVNKISNVTYTAAQINTGVANGINVDTLIAQAKLAMFPVGSIYINIDGRDPNTCIGGTWTRIKDRFLLAVGDTYGHNQQAGEATVTLSTNTIPSHNHNVTGMSRSAGYTTDTTLSLQADGNLVMYSVKGGEWHATWAASWCPTHNVDAAGGSHYYNWTLGAGDWGTSFIGGGQPHNNMPPYQTVYIWQRTA